MKGWKRTVTLNVPKEKVFAFITNPENTPRWVANITQASSDAFPPSKGTIYKNTADGITWQEYTVLVCEPPTLFTLKNTQTSYHVSYKIVEISPTQCQLMYHEWVVDEELTHPFQLSYLMRLKELVESES